MSRPDDSVGEMHEINLTDELLEELRTVDGDMVAVTAFLLELRGRYGPRDLPEVGAPLAQLMDVGLVHEGDSMPSVTTRRTTMITKAAAFVGSLTGKLVLGTALAVASVGSAQAAGVVDLPVLPSPHKTPAVVLPGDGGPVDDVDDGQVGDTDDGQTDDVDSGQVDDTNDGASATRMTATQGLTEVRTRSCEQIRTNPSRGSIVVGTVLVVGAVVVRGLADHVELVVEIDLDLASILELDLDAEGGSVVADLGLGVGSATRLLEGRGNSLVEGRASQRPLVIADTARDGDGGAAADQMTTANAPAINFVLRFFKQTSPSSDPIRCTETARPIMPTPLNPT